MPWVTISIVLGIVMMLIVGILIMYQTKAFWGLENNSNANTLNTTMNVATATGLTPVIGIIVLVIAVALIMCTTRGFG